MPTKPKIVIMLIAIYLLGYKTKQINIFGNVTQTGEKSLIATKAARLSHNKLPQQQYSKSILPDKNRTRIKTKLIVVAIIAIITRCIFLLYSKYSLYTAKKRKKANGKKSKR